MTALVLRRCSTASGQVDDRQVVDLAVIDGLLVDPSTVGVDREEIDLGGRAVVPGLADHHIHLFALAAADRSVDLSPDALAAGGGLVAALRRARQHKPAEWLRGIGYDVASSGLLDRHALDAAQVGPVRVQDRTGILWILDSAGLDAVLPPDSRDWPAGVDHVDGEATGALVRLDHWLGHRVPVEPVDLGAVARRLVSHGVTAVTDAGAGNTGADLRAFDESILALRVAAMTREVDEQPVGRIALGPVKVLLDDADLPPLDELVQRVDAAHAAGRAVAVHCVSDAQVVLALAAGIGPGDRIEHGSLVPDGVLEVLAAAGPTMVTQPGLIWTRGDRYLAEVGEAEHPGLHRLASFRRAGLRVAASSDAPYGPDDPWLGMRAAVERRTSTGSPFGPDEAVTPADAVDLFTGHLDDPARARTLRPGDVADLVVLDDDWTGLAVRPLVLATMVAGQLVHGSWPG